MARASTEILTGATAVPPKSQLAGMRRWWIPAAVGLAPLFVLLLSWVPEGGTTTYFHWYIKSLAIPVLLVELLVVGVAFRLWFRSAAEPVRLPAWAAICLCAFFTITLLSPALGAVDPSVSYFRTAVLLLHILFGWSMFRLCRERALLGPDLVAATLIGFVLLCAALAVYVLGLQDMVAFNWMNGLPGFDNVRRIAYLAAPIAGLAFARFAVGDTSSAKAASFLVLTAALTLILWSGARGAVVAVGVACLVGAALDRRLRDLRLWAAAAIALCAAALLAHWLAVPAAYMGMGRMAEFDVGGSSADPSSGVTSGRVGIWQGALDAIGQRPLLGYGEGQFWFVSPIARTLNVLHPHNVLLQIVLAWGIVGALLLALLAVPLTRRLLASARSGDPKVLPPFLAVLVLGIYAGVDGTLFHVQAASLFAAFLGVALAQQAPRNTNSQW